MSFLSANYANLREFPNTEPRRPATFRAVGNGARAPKGLGMAGYKPLMRNRKGRCAPATTGYLPGTLS